MKTKQELRLLRAKSIEELHVELTVSYEQLASTRMDVVSGKTKDNKATSKQRKKIARILTLIKEKEH